MSFGGKAYNFTHSGGVAAFIICTGGKSMETVEYWKGPVTFTRKEHSKEFSVLRWLARAVSKDSIHYVRRGIYVNRVGAYSELVATDGRHLHRVMLHGDPKLFAGLPEGKTLGFKADSKQVVFTEEIEGEFPDYEGITPDVKKIEPFSVYVCKDGVIGYTEALYELYSRGIKMNALHIQGLEGTGCPEWSVYNAGSAVVCIQDAPDVAYTAVASVLRP
jgi:hypothetical protein